MSGKFYIEVACEQRNYGSERICGDVFVSRKVKEENRTIAVLSDGMGHGVKANVLATLTATMAASLTREHRSAERIAEMIMNTLPVCSERRMSYATFTIVDIEHDGMTTILEFDNPQAMVLRDNKPFNPGWNCLMLKSDKNYGKEILSCRFKPDREDRIVFCSDGVAQSGLGTDRYPLGWGREKIEDYVIRLVGNSPRISAARLAARVIQMAHRNDDFSPKDDTSCAAIYFRQPRRLMIVTGPPYEKENDHRLGEVVRSFKGRKVVCGATTADIVARELGVEIEDSLVFDDPELPPVAQMDGIDLVTEGILTISKVTRLLKDYSPSYTPGKGPADRILNLVRESDEIHFIIGTRINIAHQDPSLPVELEMRRTVVKRMARLLEEKFLKEVSITYI